jgi:hypothetical protein
MSLLLRSKWAKSFSPAEKRTAPPDTPVAVVLNCITELDVETSDHVAPVRAGASMKATMHLVSTRLRPPVNVVATVRFRSSALTVFVILLNVLLFCRHSTGM